MESKKLNFFLLPFLTVIFLTTYSNAASKCAANFATPRISSQQEYVKDAILKLLANEKKWPVIIKGLDALMPEIAKLSEEQKLKPVLSALAKKLFAMGKLPERITKDNLVETVDLLVTMIENQFIAKGMSEKSQHRYISWLEASRNIENLAQRSSVSPKGPDSPSAFSNPEFIREFEALSEAKFGRANAVKLLVDGPQSFPMREKAINGARKSIYVMSWAFEKDTTGWKFAKQLVAQHKAGLDVRIIVDNKTAQQEVYGAVPAWMKEQGVPVIQWKDPKAPMYAFHKKCMIIDGMFVIGGGMNFGDVYSHLGPEKTPKWRDTDIFTDGDAAIESQAMFINNWNSQVEKNNLSYSKLVFDYRDYSPILQPSGPLVMVLDKIPNPEVKDLILTGIVKGIEGATKEINIENAYFIENPAIQQAIIRALKRGVKVRIFSNSATSIDVPIIAKPILDGLYVLHRFGAEVYLKQGATLHSKFMTVDGLISWVMSYNLHPQSMRIQGENAFIILDAQFANELTSQFQLDVTTLATRVTDAKTLLPPRNLIDIILQHYFFDQL